MNALANRQDTRTEQRLHFLDNLRAFAVLLVILCHSGGVYESSGIWAMFWIVDDPAINNQAGIVNIILDIFMMPTLFFISGYLAPASLRNRNGWAFIKAKSRRLLLPWAIAVLTLIPLYKVLFLYSRGLPQQHWTTYFHFSNGIFSQSWLWFLPVLFSFNVLYLLLSKSKMRIPNISVRTAILGAFFMGLGYSLAMDILGLQGWTKIGAVDFQNERLLIYLLAFLVGALYFQRDVFAAGCQGRILYYTVNALCWIPVMAYIILLLYPWFKPGQFVVSPSFHRVALWLSFHVSLLCLLYVTIETFRRCLNTQGPIRRELNRNSYYVYIIHTIVLGGIALLLLDTTIPSLWKYVILTLSTYAASQIIVSLGRKAFASICLSNAPSGETCVVGARHASSPISSHA